MRHFGRGAGARPALTSAATAALPAPFILAPSGAAQTCDGPQMCTVVDPTGTPLNVRAEPGGEIVGSWTNGIAVRSFERRTHHGKLWVAVERIAEDNVIGFVFDPYLKCEVDAAQ